MKPMDELVEKLAATDLDILIAPPSVLRYLADNRSKIIAQDRILQKFYQVDKNY